MQQEKDILKLEQFASTNYTFDFEKDFTKTSEEDAKDIKDFCDKFFNSMNKHFEIWRAMGLFGTKRYERKKYILALLEDIINDSLEKDTESYNSLDRYVHSKCKEINQLLEELKLEPYNILNENLPLIPKAKKMIDKYAEIMVLVNERLNRWDSLNKLFTDLKNKLGISKSAPIFSTKLPSEEDIADLQSKVSELKKLKTSRIRLFRCNQQSLRELIAILEIVPNEEINMIFSADEEKTILSNEFIEKVEMLNRQLEKESEINRKAMDGLKSRLEKLWERLEISHEEREAAIDSISGWKPSSLEAIKKVINKYEQIKKENISKFIEKIRLEIIDLWDKCFCSITEKETFAMYLDEDIYTDELLLIHEKELERLKQYYNKNHHIIEKFEEWIVYWQRFLELERESQDPARLLDRRRNLFKDQKIKKENEKNLLKTEKILANLCEAYAKSEKQEFLVEGKSLLAFIRESWAKLNEDKENVKKDRKKVKDKENMKKVVCKENSRNTPTLIQRTPTKVKTPKAGQMNSAQKTRVIGQPSLLHTKNLANKVKSSKGYKNKLHNAKDSFKILALDHIISPLPNSPTTIDHIIDEDKFLAELKQRQQETFESTSLSTGKSTPFNGDVCDRK